MLVDAVIVLGALLVLGAIWLLIAGIRLLRITRDWVRLFRSGADTIELVSIEPPKGFLIHRDATVTLGVTSADGETKLVNRAIPVPIPQAFLWRVAGRVPTPIGHITDRRLVGRRIWHRRRHDQGQPV